MGVISDMRLEIVSDMGLGVVSDMNEGGYIGYGIGSRIEYGNQVDFGSRGATTNVISNMESRYG